MHHTSCEEVAFQSYKFLNMDIKLFDMDCLFSAVFHDNRMSRFESQRQYRVRHIIIDFLMHLMNLIKICNVLYFKKHTSTLVTLKWVFAANS